jgi:formamidopyrimidine-DNA glycosylase
VPELPEVETTRRGIHPHLVGRKITSVIVREPRLRWPVTPALSQYLTGQTISEVSRRAKYLFLKTSAGRVMIHLGMSGSLRVLPAETFVEKHDHIDLRLDNGQVLRYRDPRRFGSFFWLAHDESHTLINSLGPEPLSEHFDGDHLFNQSRKKSVAIKQFVMDGKIVVGVGNIYANESLFMSGIRPDRKAGSVSRKRYQDLAVRIKSVLSAAIEAGGTTLRDFVNEDGNPGYFKHELKVYGRGGEPCLSCSLTLTETRLGQRTTVFCRKCQR